MTQPAWTLDAALGASLPRFARACIAEALGAATPAERPRLPGVERIGATFVSLHRGEALHGCIGSLTAWRPLLDDVKRNALAAAFEDPRAPSLDAAGLRALEVEVSVLSPPTPVDFDTQADLLSTLRPGVDGLILEWGGHRGTFLPQVWEQLPEPEDFLNHLKRKAGLRVDFWAPDVKIDRYTVQAFVDPPPGAP